MAHEDFARVAPVEGSSNRSFGLVFAAVFLIIALFPLISGGAFRWWSAALAFAFGTTALMMPTLLHPLNRAWTRLGVLLHRVVSPIILGFMFYAVVTPIGLLMRALGKDPLRLRFDGDASSYWIARTPPGPTPERLKDQF